MAKMIASGSYVMNSVKENVAVLAKTLADYQLGTVSKEHLQLTIMKVREAQALGRLLVRVQRLQTKQISCHRPNRAFF